MWIINILTDNLFWESGCNLQLLLIKKDVDFCQFFIIFKLCRKCCFFSSWINFQQKIKLFMSWASICVTQKLLLILIILHVYLFKLDNFVSNLLAGVVYSFLNQVFIFNQNSGLHFVEKLKSKSRDNKFAFDCVCHEIWLQIKLNQLICISFAFDRIFLRHLTCFFDLWSHFLWSFGHLLKIWSNGKAYNHQM